MTNDNMTFWMLLELVGQKEFGSVAEESIEMS